MNLNQSTYHPTGLTANPDATIPFSARGITPETQGWSPHTDRLTSPENTSPTVVDEIGEDVAAEATGVQPE